MADWIEPKILKGFRDFKPETEIPRKQQIRTLEAVFERFGFVPIDTPVLEYTEILLGKGGGETDKQLYRFLDNGKRDVAMRFDLTVPFARFMAAHFQELPLPFKRYHIAKVWRGENTQKGRYREFMQCDFDIVGCDSPESDFEILSLMEAAFRALSIPDLTVRLSHRGLLNDFLRLHQIEANPVELLRIIDKLPKIGEGEVVRALSALCTPQQVQAVLQFISIKGPLRDALPQAAALTSPDNAAIRRLQDLHRLTLAAGIDQRFVLDLSVTRGLDYYTGIVYESFIHTLPDLGSVCSGGRYDSLASLYTKESLPGVGASIGIDRLMAGLSELHAIQPASGLTQILILNTAPEPDPRSFQTAAALRDKGFSVEVYLQPKKLSSQFKYAEKKAIPYALLPEETPLNEARYTLKNVQSRETVSSLSREALLAALPKPTAP